MNAINSTGNKDDILADVSMVDPQVQLFDDNNDNGEDGGAADEQSDDDEPLTIHHLSHKINEHLGIREGQNNLLTKQVTEIDDENSDADSNSNEEDDMEGDEAANDINCQIATSYQK